jgi:hypothetical protein
MGYAEATAKRKTQVQQNHTCTWFIEMAETVCKRNGAAQKVPPRRSRKRRHASAYAYKLLEREGRLGRGWIHLPRWIGELEGRED